MTAMPLTTAQVPDSRTMLQRRARVALLCALLPVACTAARPEAQRAAAPTRSPLLDPAGPGMQHPAPATFKVLFETTKGDFVVHVQRDLAPTGAQRFYNLVRNGYYDGASLFRMVPGFVVQFGIHPDTAINAAWRSARIRDDSVRASNTRGMVTFATSGPNSRTVQIFINLGNNARLDAMGFAPFGRVTGGMDAVDQLHAGYGELPPRGRAPDQNRMQTEGDAYIVREFPQLDRVVRARIIPDS